MKRYILFLVLLSSSCFAINMGDIVKWSLVRKTDTDVFLKKDGSNLATNFISTVGAAKQTNEVLYFTNTWGGTNYVAALRFSAESNKFYFIRNP